MSSLMLPSDLLGIAESCYFPLRLTIAEPTRRQYRIAFHDFGSFLGRPATTADLDDDLITMWMRKRLNDGLAVVTVRERAGRVATMWTWMAKRRMVQTFPTFTKPVPPESLPQALSEDELRRLFASARKERGTIGSIPADLWWISFLAFVWNTSERKSAALAVRVKWIDLGQSVATVPPEVRKGGKKWAVYQLWPETLPLLAAVIAVDPARELVWPFPFCAGSYYTRYDRILRDAGLPVSRKTKTHCLRCSHATWRSVAGGDATRALGHSDPQTTRKYYLDPRFQKPDTGRLFIPWGNSTNPPGNPPS